MSTTYVDGLGDDQLNDLALYLNFDILGSPNTGFFTYDDDQSGQPNPNIPAGEVPAGSAGIERTLPATSTWPGYGLPTCRLPAPPTTARS